MDIEKDYNNIEILPSEDGRYYLEYRLYTYGSEPQYHVSQDTLTFRCIQNPQTQMNVAGFHGMEHKRPFPLQQENKLLVHEVYDTICL